MDSLIFYILLMSLYWSTKHTEFNLGLSHTHVDSGGPEIDVSMLLLKYLGLDTCL